MCRHDLILFVDQNVVPKLKTRFCHFKLSLQDKMEELKFSSKGKSWEWQRRGKRFRIDDRQGVLPLPTIENQALEEMWRKILAFPSVTGERGLISNRVCASRNKRRVIVEEDEDERTQEILTIQTSKSSNKEPSTQTNSGLMVRVTNPSKGASEISKKIDISLNDIKASHGVDGEAWASNFVALLDEERKDTTCNEELDDVMKKQERIEAQIGQLKQKLRGIKKQEELNAWMDASDDSDLLVRRFHILEELRDCLVRSGNTYLWSLSKNSVSGPNNQERKQSLKDAWMRFDETSGVVQHQKKLLPLLEKSGRIETEELRFQERSLLLLEGRTKANRGIAYVMLCEQRTDKSSLIDSINDFEDACSTAVKVVNLAYRDFARNGINALRDELLALGLKSLACRWKGKALWCQKKYSESLEAFRESTSVMKNWIDEDLIESELELWLALYEGSTMAYNLAWEGLVKLPFEELRSESGKKQIEFFLGVADEMYDSISKAIQGIKSIVLKVSSIDLDTFMKDNDVQTSDEAKCMHENKIRFWKYRESKLLQPLPSHATGFVPNQRSNLQLCGQENGFKEVFTVLPFPNQQKRKLQPHSTGAARNLAKRPNYNSENQVPLPSQRKANMEFQKWGDDLLPKVKDPNNGNMVPILRYPCIAPPMPPDVAAVAKRLGHHLSGTE